MSQLEDLITKYCPDGVDFIELQKLFNTRNGYTPSRRKPEYWENGTVPWFRMDDIRANGNVLSKSTEYIADSAVKKGRLFPADTLIVATSATIGVHALIEIPFLCNQRFSALIINKEYKDLFRIKFLFYYCYVLDEWCLRNTTQSSFAAVDMKRFQDFKFPVPPLEVQDEIVRILDSFTQLEAELEAELEARRKQYEYYRDSLLHFDDSKQSLLDSEFQKNQFRDYLTVDEICNVTRGKVISKQYLRDHPGVYPVYSSQTINSGIFGNIDSFMFDGEYLTWTTDGANAGSVFYRNGKFNTTNVCGLLELTDERFDIRFLFHYLSIALPKYVSTGMGNRKLMSNVVKSVRIPFVQKAEQKRIAAILDKFDALVNDLSSGLPAEITARRKQYEYYRDRLLTFTPAK